MELAMHTGSGDAETIGVQIAPWASARELVTTTALLGKAFDVVWVPDQMLARNVYVVLSAIAASGHIGVASGVTFPLSRNPIDMASAMATIGELAPPDRPVLMGMGAGGSLVASLFSKRSATLLVRESIDLIRRLWAGESVQLSEYPALSARLGWREDASARLSYQVSRRIPIMVAVGGPKTLQLAEQLADGLICTSTFPSLSYAALRSRDYSTAHRIIELAKRRRHEGRDMRLVYGLNCCVSADRAAARAFGRRQAALTVANPALWTALESTGLDLESARAVRTVFEQGAGVDAAARQVSDGILDAFIVSGTPDECIEQLAELRGLARAAGFVEFYLGVPLGPDLAEAAQILVDTVVPELWPARR
ncbi:MAG: LLM class flavin-dependent oxidoreductase [Pseudonocardiaceae bacterium]